MPSSSTSQPERNPMKTCAYITCTNEFVVTNRHPARQYCSKPCRVRARQVRNGFNVINPNIILQCANPACGETFELTTPNKRFCGKKCRVKCEDSNNLRRRWYNLKTQQGVTDTFEEFLYNIETHGKNGCEMPGCGKTDEGRSLHYDHNHETGKFRGMLCYMHNQGLGMFHDDPDELMQGAQYLLERN